MIILPHSHFTWGNRIFEALTFRYNEGWNVLYLVASARMCYLLVLERQWEKEEIVCKRLQSVVVLRTVQTSISLEFRKEKEWKEWDGAMATIPGTLGLEASNSYLIQQWKGPHPREVGSILLLWALPWKEVWGVLPAYAGGWHHRLES